MKQKHGRQARALVDMALGAIVLFCILFSIRYPQTLWMWNISSSKPEIHDLDDLEIWGGLVL
jgi:hypothetical protein